MSSKDIKTSSDYRQWLIALKSKFRQVQLKAAVRVNQSLLEFYWQLGQEIVENQAQFAWGEGFLNQLSADLVRDFPEIKGFSLRNLKYIRQWFVYWTASAIGQQAVAQLLSLPWGHNLVLIAKCKNYSEALYYAQNAIEHGWSRS